MSDSFFHPCKRAVWENKKAILGMKRHFLGSKSSHSLEGKGTCNLTPSLWSGHSCMFQAKTVSKNFPRGTFFLWVRYPDP